MLQRLSRVTSGVLAAAAFLSIVGIIVALWVPLGWPAGKSDMGALHRLLAGGAAAFTGLALMRGARRWTAAPRYRWAADLLPVLAAVLAVWWLYRGTAVFLKVHFTPWP
jgi:hypothetical protein